MGNLISNLKAQPVCYARLIGYMALVLSMCGWQCAGEADVRVWLSTQDGRKQLSEGPPLSMGDIEDPDALVVRIDPETQYQSMLGLGSSFEHATIENLYRLPEEERNAVIKRIVHPVEGIGMNLMRICIGASDFIGEPYYTYLDLPAGQTDEALQGFSIEKDRARVIPTIKKALEYNPDLLLFASPWSPPAWMKTNGQLGGGKLKREYFDVYARYLLRFLQAYADEGIPIHAITVQNEPRMIHPAYPTALWTAEEQRDFIRDYLGPLFRENAVTTRIWCWDHNWNNLDFPRTVLGDPDAARFVEGTAFHHYEGDVTAQSEFRAEFPGKDLFFTEGSVFRTTGAIRLIHILRNWSRSYNAWVTMLDEHRKPNRGPHSASATCIELKDDLSVEYRYDYYMYGQFMKFIQRGAVRIASDESDSRHFAHVAFRNPDGTFTAVFANAGRHPQTFCVKFEEKGFRYQLPANAVVTFVWAS